VRRPALALVALLLAAHAAMAAGCDNFFGQRCRVQLPTGIAMSYFETGPADGETLIFLHTDTTSAVDWAWTVQALAQSDPDLRLIALDQRGAGLTELPDTAACWARPNLCVGPAELAQDVIAFMEVKEIEKAVLIGHAWGASVARRVALHHPDKVAKLILIGAGGPSGAAPKPDPAAIAAFRDKIFRPLGWQKMLEDKGVAWPEGALHMRPIDIDPGAVDNIARNWDISAVALPEVVAAIAAQTAAEPLASWGYGLDPSFRPTPAPERLDTLTVPTLAIWATEDAAFKSAQDQLIAALRAAAKKSKSMAFWWKQYGIRPPPASGDKHDADDIGHDIPWEAPRELAADIASFVRAGKPTPDLYHTDAPADIHRIVTEPGKAVIVSSRP
jgi:pimeloyl-ACP methyl ester carboxylesterase